jgi:hypothetical protein
MNVFGYLSPCQGVQGLQKYLQEQTLVSLAVAQTQGKSNTPRPPFVSLLLHTLVGGFCTTVLCTRYSLSEIAPTKSVSKLPTNCKRPKVALFHKLKKRMELPGNWGLQEWVQKTGRGTDDI